MSRIEDVRLIGIAYDLPPGKAYGMARRLSARRECVLVEALTEDGVRGIGEAWGPVQNAAGWLPMIRDAFVGREIYDHPLIFSDIISGAYHAGLQNALIATLGGLEIALFDAMGKTLCVPVCKLLGGRGKARIPVYASDGYITNDPDGQLDAQVERIAGKGFPGAKFKIGLGPRSDEERVRLARKILGDEMLLMVDVNGNYTVDLALESMRRIAPYGIHFYEEPLPPQDVQGYALLAGRATIPVAAGEALYTVFDFQRLLKDRAIDVAQPDLALCGGFGQAKAIALLCQLHNVHLSPHVWGSAVGLAAALHFMAALPDYPHTDHVPHPRLVEYDVGDNPLRDELLTAPLEPIEGHIVVPDGPGLGIEIDAQALARYRVE
ncbi:MAG: mandelate racemase/muconate lactonizing enzyme family protein [Geminicoccaceae bacterium]